MLADKDSKLTTSHLDDYLTVITKLKKSFEDEPSKESFPNDFFKFRKEINGVSLEYGSDNDLIAVLAFRMSARTIPTIENDLKPYGIGSDFLVDALTTRCNDIQTSAMSKMVTDNQLESTLEHMQSTEGANLLKKICMWEPMQFKVIETGSRLFSQDSVFLGNFFSSFHFNIDRFFSKRVKRSPSPQNFFDRFCVWGEGDRFTFFYFLLFHFYYYYFQMPFGICTRPKFSPIIMQLKLLRPPKKKLSLLAHFCAN